MRSKIKYSSKEKYIRKMWLLSSLITLVLLPLLVFTYSESYSGDPLGDFMLGSISAKFLIWGLSTFLITFVFTFLLHKNKPLKIFMNLTC